jgi:hypothetical protein
MTNVVEVICRELRVACRVAATAIGEIVLQFSGTIELATVASAGCCRAADDGEALWRNTYSDSCVPCGSITAGGSVATLLIISASQ